MTPPLVVVPTLYKRHDYLSKALASLKRQNPEPVVRLVAPRSVHASLISTHGDLFDDLREDPGLGLSSAVNAGWFDLGKWSVVTWLGDDDLLEDGSLDRTTSALRRADAVLAYGGLRWIDEIGEELRVTIPLGVEPWLLRYGSPLVWQPGSLYRASAVRQIGGLNVARRYAMDFELILRLSLSGRAVPIRRPLGSYRIHGDTISSNWAEQWAETQLIQQEVLGRRPVRNRMLAPSAILASRVIYRLTSRKRSRADGLTQAA